MSPRQTNRSTRWASAAEKHAVRAPRFAWMSVRMAVRIGAAPEYTARARTSSAPGAALSPLRKRLLQRQIGCPLRPAAQLFRVVVARRGSRHVRGQRVEMDELAEGVEPVPHLREIEVAQPVEAELLHREGGDGGSHHRRLPERRGVV